MFPLGRRLRRQSLRQVVSVDGLVELLLPQESVRGTPDATWLLGPVEAKICGALYTQLCGFTLAFFTISASRRVQSSEPPTFATKAASGERVNLRGLVRSMFCATSLEPKLKVCDVFSRDLEPNHQGKSLTVTSPCDLGKASHLGLYLRHAVIAQGVALLQQAHACTKFHHCFPSFSTVNDS